MLKDFILYGTSCVFIIGGLVLVNTGLRKDDFKAIVKTVNYRPIRNYGKGYSIVLGVFCFILGLILIFSKV